MINAVSIIICINKQTIVEQGVMGCQQSQIKQNNYSQIKTFSSEKSQPNATIIQQQSQQQINPQNLNYVLLEELKKPIYSTIISSKYLQEIIQLPQYSFTLPQEKDAIYGLVLNYMDRCILNYTLKDSAIKPKGPNHISVLGQKLLKLKNEIYFNNNDTLKILKFIYQKDTNNKQFPIFSKLQFSFSKNQALQIASKVKYLCRYDQRSFMFLSNYLYKCCLKLQGQKVPLKEIEKKLLQILSLISKVHPPAPPLEGSEQLFQRHPSYQSSPSDGATQIDLSNILPSQRLKHIQTYILYKTNQAKNNYNIFVQLIKQICTKQGYHFKSNLKLNSMDDQRSFNRIKQKLIDKSFQKITLDEGNGIKTIKEFVQYQEKDHQRKMKQMYEKLDSKVLFKVTDLLRAKCMFASINDINGCCEELKKQIQKKGFKLLQIDNRLRSNKGTSDIVLKILINSTIAQLQLVIDLNIASYEFSHKIYQIVRSKFYTPLTILSIINQDITVPFVRELQEIIDINNRSQKQVKYKEKFGYCDVVQAFQEFKLSLPFEKDCFLSLQADLLVMLPKGASLNQFTKIRQKLSTMIKKSKEIIVMRTNLLHKSNAQFKVTTKQYEQAKKQAEIYRQQSNQTFQELLKKITKNDQLTPQQRQYFLDYAQNIKILGRIQQNKGLPDKAITYYKQYANYITRIDPNDKDSLISKIQFNISWLQYKRSNFQLALESYNKIFKTQQQKFGKQNLQSASTLNNIGLCLHGLGKYQQSLKYYQQALLTRQKKLGKNSFQCTSTLNNIGLAYYNMSEYSSALANFQTCLQIKQKVKGKVSTDCALTLNNIGMVYSSQGNLQQALKQYKRSLEIRQIIRGPQHIQCATTINNIGLIYFRQGQNEEALKHYRRSLNIRSNFYGSDYIDCSISYLSLGEVYQRQRKFKEAEQMFEKGMSIRERVRGKQSVYYAVALVNCAQLLIQRQQYRKGIDILQQSYSIIIKTKGEKVKLASIKAIIGHTYVKIGYIQEAEKYLNESLDIFKAIKGENSIDCSEIYCHMADLMVLKGQIKVAQEFYKKCIGNFEKIGYLYRYYSLANVGLGQIYDESNRIKQAQQCYRKAETVLKKFDQIAYNDLLNKISSIEHKLNRNKDQQT